MKFSAQAFVRPKIYLMGFIFLTSSIGAMIGDYVLTKLRFRLKNQLLTKLAKEWIKAPFVACFGALCMEYIRIGVFGKNPSKVPFFDRALPGFIYQAARNTVGVLLDPIVSRHHNLPLYYLDHFIIAFITMMIVFSIDKYGLSKEIPSIFMAAFREGVIGLAAATVGLINII